MFTDIQTSLSHRRWDTILALLLALLAFIVRVDHLGFNSLSEDESAKWFAIQEYRQGHFAGVNSEHPMILKTLAWASLTVGERWNYLASFHNWPSISPEALLRFPNVLFGAATAAILYLLCRRMMGIAGSLAASLFWAVAPLPVALNRLAKEETPLTFFTLLACYCYCRAKQADQLTTRKWYDLSAIGFGLAFASQYIFHLFGLNSLAWHLAGRNGIDNKPLASAGKRFFLVIFLTMAVVNPVMFSPANLTSVLQWLHHDGVRHTGYDFNGALYLNFPSRLFAGVPWYFYIWLVVLKTPIPILLFILLGSVLLLCNRQTLASCFFLSLGVTQFIAISICGAKWMRYSLPLLPFLFLAGGYGVHTAWKYVREKTVPAVLVGMAAMLVIAWPIREFRAWAPYYPLYLNSFGGGTRNIAHYFAPDEVSEFDTRQVAQDVSKTASGGATLATARPMTMTYYLQRFGRTDIQVIPLYDSSYVPHGGDLIVLEPSRRFLETQRYFDFLQPSYMVHRNISVGPVVASTIYIFEESQAVKAPRMPTIVTAERIRLTVQPRGERQRDKGSVFTIKYREYELTRNLEQRAALSALKAQTSR